MNNWFAYSFRRRGIFLLCVNFKDTACGREKNFVTVEDRSQCFSFFKRCGGWVNAFFKFLLISYNVTKQIIYDYPLTIPWKYFETV